MAGNSETEGVDWLAGEEDKPMDCAFRTGIQDSHPTLKPLSKL